MKAVILAGGQGSRLGESSLPKPVVDIGGKPVLWHIMSSLADAGVDDFQIALGYRADVVTEHLRHAALKDTSENEKLEFTNDGTQWTASLIDTGEHTATAGRLRRLQSCLAGERFILAWADGLTSADICAMTAYHLQHGKLATILAVHPPARFGQLMISDDNQVTEFLEKQSIRNDWINGGIYIFETEVLDLIAGDDSSLEYDVLPVLVRQGQLMSWQHEGFWQCMDYQHEVKEMNKLWESGAAPWKK